ncbi:MAG: flagellar biosynthetic protein FliR, partial [Zoogloea sp.]|nr:flagellar biosynthetic protein FliR [Zoogloea sp.]
MISFTSAQLDALLTAIVFPMARILGMVSAAPIFSNRALPTRIRLFAGLAIGIAVVPALPAAPAIAAGSWIGMVILAQQALIGIAIGFTMRVIFAAVDFAGTLMGMQMGLSFASFYDPQSGGQTPVLSEFIGLLASLTFLAMNGHLLMIDVLVRTFEWLPVSTDAIHA